MAEETTPRQHYNAFIGKKDEARSLSALVDKLNEKDVIARHEAVKALGIPDNPVKVRYDALSDQIQGRANLTTAETKVYFAKNLDDIIDGVPQNRLDQVKFNIGVIQTDSGPVFDADSVKTGKKAHDSFVEREASYHNTNRAIQKVIVGKAGDLEKEFLTETVGDYLAQRERENLEGKGYDFDGELRGPLNAVLRLAKSRAYLISGNQLYGTAQKLADDLRDELESETPENYATDKLKALGKNRPETTEEIIYATKNLRD